jgi:hypothetical protein
MFENLNFFANLYSKLFYGNRICFFFWPQLHQQAVKQKQKIVEKGDMLKCTKNIFLNYEQDLLLSWNYLKGV